VRDAAWLMATASDNTASNLILDKIIIGRVWAGKAVSARADSAMLDILEHNEDNQLLQRCLEGVRAAHKTGAVDDACTGCSLLYLLSALPRGGVRVH
jgi:Beta-lactamase enzyme family